MNTSEQDRPLPNPPPTVRLQPPSPCLPMITNPTSGAQRKVAIAVDLSDESAYAVRWSVQNYLRPGDAVILLHVRPTSVLYGADWGAVQKQQAGDDRSDEQVESDFDDLTASKAKDLAQPLVEAQVPYKIHILKDHDLKERLCLEVERLGLSAMIMGSRGFGAARTRRKSKLGKLGTVSDYCVQHCVCPVVVVRYPDDKEGNGSVSGCGAEDGGKEAELHPVPEEDDQEYHDVTDEYKEK
ncbi:hypothetical protein CRG98_006895 [Punica granatum]|uniref:UspA domain-containing protein n=1 Tax=Punica granatum TaxID=22663 RepID=A0A2I0KY11_PUNGR|nr:hypothetical protein CRG98_006895 [Punica granatum]